MVRHGSVRTRLFITIWLDQLVQNLMHIVPKNLGHVLERQLSYDLGKKVVRVCSPRPQIGVPFSVPRIPPVNSRSSMP